MILKPFCFSWWSACISGQAAGAPAATTARHCIGEHLICATADLVSMTNGSPPASLTTRLISCALLGLLSHTTTNGRRPSDGVVAVLWVSEFECVAVKTALQSVQGTSNSPSIHAMVVVKGVLFRGYKQMYQFADL